MDIIYFINEISQWIILFVLLWAANAMASSLKQLQTLKLKELNKQIAVHKIEKNFDKL